MKKLTALTVGCLLIASLNLTFADPVNEADQKWLEVVQKKVVEGQTRISTPIEDRVALLKEWAGKNGYAVEVSKSEQGFRLEVSKSVAQK